ncbi:hypothetical protein EVAR_9706_1 [Eumeta japonica]|uniref:Uncharacterized protein n=1 Tax=Eumeta variegata TaxID=151549 RepID=A0A4C1YY81_EUMVA|nr:hypothetical protein EVAR_9706_1 [Eumeta japonica]
MPDAAKYKYRVLINIGSPLTLHSDHQTIVCFGVKRLSHDHRSQFQLVLLTPLACIRYTIREAYLLTIRLFEIEGIAKCRLTVANNCCIQDRPFLMCSLIDGKSGLKIDWSIATLIFALEPLPSLSLTSVFTYLADFENEIGRNT